MNCIQFVKIVLRFFSIWLFWLSLQQVVVTIATRASLDEASTILYSIVVIYFFCGLIIWLFSEKIAQWISGDITNCKNILITAYDGVLISAVFTGLLIIGVDALEDTGNYIARIAMFIASGQTDLLFSMSVNIAGLVAISKIIFGLILISKSKWIAKKMANTVS